MSDVEDEVRTRLKVAARRRFTEVGFGSSTVDELAAGAGVGVASLYRRWPDKASLANELVADYLDIVESILDLPEKGTAKQQFLTLWRRLWQAGIDDPDQLLFGETNAQAPFVTAELLARKDVLNERSAAVLVALGVTAPPAVAGALVFGTLTAALPHAAEVDADDLGERLWAALRR